MPISFREGPYFSARQVVIPENAEVFNDRLYGLGDPRFEEEERVPRWQEPPVPRQIEPLSSWIERSYGPYWYETARERRAVEVRLRGELREGATLLGEHFGRIAEIHFDGFTFYGPEGLFISPGITLFDHFVRLGLQVDPGFIAFSSSVRAMSELLRISIAPMVVRLKMYLETAQENLGKELTDQSEKYNGKWEAIFLRVKGQALQDEEQNYRDFKPEGKAFMHWVDQARGLVDTIEGALGLSELGDAIPQPNQPAQVVQQPQLVHHRHDVTLPPITLPKFSGESREWPLFWKLFETSVESLQIEDFKKHIYLLGCLPEKSVARRAIDLYPPSDENYPRVVEILKKRFGDEKTMVESLQEELLHLPKPAKSVQSMRQFSESIERICHQLLDYGENEQNKFMASTIKSKLPYHLLTQVVEKEMRAGGTFNCTELRRPIASIVEVKEEVQRCTQVFRGEEKHRNFPPYSNEGRVNQGRGTPFRFSRPFREERWRRVEGNETAMRISPQPNHSFYTELVREIHHAGGAKKAPRDILPQVQRNNFHGRGTESLPNQFTKGHERPDNRNDSVGMMSPTGILIGRRPFGL
ncbi:hypothetical protein niasHT_033725 [Heterodera trifolii]|uniref:Uncharacterized protein n=1 Tax=Heterodera trifolii TaxID=157864 RepID=A0ABD2IKV1_9BILA